MQRATLHHRRVTDEPAFPPPERVDATRGMTPVVAAHVHAEDLVETRPSGGERDRIQAGGMSHLDPGLGEAPPRMAQRR